MALPVWLPVAISSAGIIVAMSAFIWQLRRTRFNQSIDLLFRLEADFFGSNKRAQRAKASPIFQEGAPSKQSPSWTSSKP